MKRCINIDWLEVYCRESGERFPCNADYYRSKGWKVIEREYGTPQYREMFTLFTPDNHPFIEVRRNPYSTKDKGGLFFQTDCHIRLSNRTCYLSNPISILRNFLIANDIELRGITRIDICLDFLHFDNNDNPQIFIKDYLRGIYSKINQSNISSHGKDTWKERIWNSLSWGSEKSMIRTKLYLKSLELREAKDKPYIRAAWKNAELIENEELSAITEKVWRLEFSIHSEAKNYIVTEDTTGRRKQQPNTLSCYDAKEKLLAIFRGLTEKYFHFKYFEEGRRKDRCKDKVLFKWASDVAIAEPVREEPTGNPSRTDKIVMNRLQRIAENGNYPMWMRKSANLSLQAVAQEAAVNFIEYEKANLEKFMDIAVDYYMEQNSAPYASQSLDTIADHIQLLRQRATKHEIKPTSNEKSIYEEARTLIKFILGKYPGTKTKQELFAAINRYSLILSNFSDIQRMLYQIERISPKVETVDDILRCVDDFYFQMLGNSDEHVMPTT